MQEIDALCAAGILEKVEYKGSISFRFTITLFFHHILIPLSSDPLVLSSSYHFIMLSFHLLFISSLHPIILSSSQ